MADVTISNLPTGTPSGNVVIPYSDGSTTYTARPSAIVASGVTSGTWSPKWVDRSNVNTGIILNDNYILRQGVYRKTGDLVYITGYMVAAGSWAYNTGVNASTQVAIGNLPFRLYQPIPAAYSAFSIGYIKNFSGNWTTNFQMLYSEAFTSINPNNTYGALTLGYVTYNSSTNYSYTISTEARWLANGVEIIFSGSYFTDQ